MNKLSPIESINNPTHMHSINNLSQVKTTIEYVMRTRVLCRPIVFLRVRCSTPHCTSILITHFQAALGVKQCGHL